MVAEGGEGEGWDLVGNLGDSVGKKSVGEVGMRSVDGGMVCEGRG